MAYQITPDQDNYLLEIGRLLSNETYKKEKKEVRISNMVFDLVKTRGNIVVIGEIKKSSKYEKSAKMQLAFYLKKFKEFGIAAVGELLFPKEKTKVSVELTEDIECELERAVKDIRKILSIHKPPSAKKSRFCRQCAYEELCWC